MDMHAHKNTIGVLYSDAKDTFRCRNQIPCGITFFGGLLTSHNILQEKKKINHLPGRRARHSSPTHWEAASGIPLSLHGAHTQSKVCGSVHVWF